MKLNEIKESDYVSLKSENEILELQVMQLEEELKYYFIKAKNITDTSIVNFNKDIVSRDIALNLELISCLDSND